MLTNRRVLEIVGKTAQSTIIMYRENLVCEFVYEYLPNSAFP